MRRVDLVLVGAALVSAAAWFLLRRAPATTERGERLIARPTLPPAGRAAPAATSRTSAPTRPRVSGGAGAGAAGLTVDADVAGADVFIDRVYKGQAPVTVTGIAPGPHRLNVSAEGYDGYAETVDVTGHPQTLTVRLAEVRLAAAIDVVHRHGLGSCRGRLSAGPSSLRYAASKASDAFDVPLSSIERLDADYAKKSLAVKLRGGRTYNFGEPGGNADALLSFAQVVTRARSRLLARDGEAARK
jgi:hypothetical protein